MDIMCTNCGEPWDVYYVTHDEPEEFERRGCAIVHCPCCKSHEEPVRSEEDREKALILGELLDGDIDGYAADCEDFGL